MSFSGRSGKQTQEKGMCPGYEKHEDQDEGAGK